MASAGSKQRSACSALLQWMLLSAICLCVSSFSKISVPRNHHGRRSSALMVSSSSDTEQRSVDSALAGSELIELSIFPHRPLGCTVEESLAGTLELGGSNHVFVTKVVEGGNAEQAGLQVGDVIVGMSSLFEGEELEDITFLGVEKIKSLVAARPDGEALALRVARGTNVQLMHEEALVELCSDPGASDKEVEDCLMDFLQSGYYDPKSSVMAPTVEEECDPGDDDCLMDSLYGMWAEDLPVSPTAAEPKPEKQQSAPKVKPWSSRSSPSGTWVRDPATGEMRNIEA